METPEKNRLILFLIFVVRAINYLKLCSALYSCVVLSKATRACSATLSNLREKAYGNGGFYIQIM